MCVNPWKCWNVFMDPYEYTGVHGSKQLWVCGCQHVCVRTRV